MSRYLIRKISELDVSNLSLKKDDDRYKICEITEAGTPSKVRRLYLVLPIMTCANGINDTYFELEPNDTVFQGLSSLEEWITERVPDYHPIEKDRLRVYLDSYAKIYDRDGEKMDDRECLNSMFRCSLIVDISEITAKSYLKISVFQMKVYSYSLLPEGCKIFDNKEQFLSHLENSDRKNIREWESIEDPVAEGYDPNVNELI